ncbi:transposase zinc-binding domain-containing protein, partial [bacterium]|nr:transposase zinc-binding domain-containing protein [bacterium]
MEISGVGLALDIGLPAMGDKCPYKTEKVYRPRRPERNPFYSVLFHYFERFAAEYEFRFEKHYGKWRSIIRSTVERFINCGVLKNGFARVRCPQCKNEYLLAFSCRRRGFCPSCSAKRSVLWREFVSSQVLADCPHSHIVFSIPKMFRILFLFHRKLLGELARCAWKAIVQYFEACAGKEVLPAGILSIATAGDFLNRNPHIHGLIACAVFRRDGSFEPVGLLQANIIRELFEANVFRLLVKKERIGKDLITRMRSWKHTGFQVYAGPKIIDKQDILRVGLYIIRPPVSASRLQLDPQNEALKYLATGRHPNDRCDSLFEAAGQLFDPIDWIAKLTSHIPEKGAQTIRYCGAYSNSHRGKLRKRQISAAAKAVCSPQPECEWVFQRRANWAALIRLVCEVDPLLCPNCHSKMDIVSVIKDGKVIDKILAHLQYKFDPLPLCIRPPL